MNCSQITQKLSDYLNEEVSDIERRQIREHIKQCDACLHELTLLQTIVREVHNLEKVNAPDTIWQGIEAQLDKSKRSLFDWNRWSEKVRSINIMPAPVIRIAGVAAVLVIGILIGKYLLIPENQSQSTLSDTSPAMQEVNARAVNYVEKSKVLFLGIVNAGASEIADSNLQQERSLARDLVQEAAYLKDNLSERNARLKQLIEELELILFEIANMDNEQDIKDVELIRSGIDEKGLLLKIYLHDLKEQPKEPSTPKA